MRLLGPLGRHPLRLVPPLDSDELETIRNGVEPEDSVNTGWWEMNYLGPTNHSISSFETGFIASLIQNILNSLLY